MIMFEKMICATDFSDHAEHAFPYVRHLADCGARRITLLHVRHDPHHDASADALAEIELVDMERLRRREAGLLADGAGEVVSLIRRGSPKHGILREIAGLEVSLVVLGRQGHGALEGWLLGSVSQAVARASTAPVLLVPMPR